MSKDSVITASTFIKKRIITTNIWSQISAAGSSTNKDYTLKRVVPAEKTASDIKWYLKSKSQYSGQVGFKN